METFSKKAILETIDGSKEYLNHLDSLLSVASAAEIQVTQSSEKSLKVVESVFEELAITIASSIKARKMDLIATINKYRTECLTPLHKSKNDIVNLRNNCSNLVDDAKRVLESGGFTSEVAYMDFMEKSSQLGSLPALPDVELVPNITFSGCTKSVIPHVSSILNNFGSISKIGPVQITDTEPYPGSLLIRWEDIDQETHFDVQSYRLQISLYNAWNFDKNIENCFRDIYQGSEQTYLVRDLKLNQKYCFRICCRASEESPWSSWSCTKVACTEVPPYTWEVDNSKYLLSDDDRLARVIDPGVALFSSEPHIKNGNSVQFIVLNASQSSSDEGVALVAVKTTERTHINTRGTFFVSFKGNIFVDGKEKTICLPVIGQRHLLTFYCEIIKGKWRVTVESGTKAVTYEWNPGTNQLYFATYLIQPAIQVLVE